MKMVIETQTKTNESQSKVYNGPIKEILLVGLEFYKVLEVKGSSFGSYVDFRYLRQSQSIKMAQRDDATAQALNILEEIANADENVALVHSIEATHDFLGTQNPILQYINLEVVCTMKGLAFQRKK